MQTMGPLAVCLCQPHIGAPPPAIAVPTRAETMATGALRRNGERRPFARIMTAPRAVPSGSVDRRTTATGESVRVRGCASAPRRHRTKRGGTAMRRRAPRRLIWIRLFRRTTTAEGVGFEPTSLLRPPVFKTGAFNRSAIPPSCHKTSRIGRFYNPRDHGISHRQPRLRKRPRGGRQSKWVLSSPGMEDGGSTCHDATRPVVSSLETATARIPREDDARPWVERRCVVPGRGRGG